VVISANTDEEIVQTAEAEKGEAAESNSLLSFLSVDLLFDPFEAPIDASSSRIP